MVIAASSGVRRILVPLVSLIAILGLPAPAGADRLVAAREVARGGYYAPRFAPDGAELLVTGPKQRGLYLAPVAGGSIRRLVDDAAAGVHARYRADGAIEFRAARAGQRRDMVLARDGRVSSVASAAAPSAQIAVEEDERIYVRRRAGEALAQVGSGDRFFAPQVSPDGDKVAFQGLATGIYLYVRSSGRLIHVGAGTAPAWSPDGSRLVYELTEDDGHELVASELRLYHVATGRTHALTASEEVIERRPGFSPDGRSIAFDDDTGGIWIARLEEGP
jgi:Tol biopolymer transport system component